MDLSGEEKRDTSLWWVGSSESNPQWRSSFGGLERVDLICREDSMRHIVYSLDTLQGTNFCLRNSLSRPDTDVVVVGVCVVGGSK